MRNRRIIALAEIGISLALCFVLNFIQIRLPINLAGGSISLVMLPIAIVALRRGPGAGAAIGLAFGVIDFLIDPYIVHWAQIILDYPLPYLAFGFGCGLLAGTTERAYGKSIGRGGVSAAVGLLTGIVLRFIPHLCSGVIFFGSAAGVDQNVWLWSAAYQCSYLLPSFIAVAILVLIVFPALRKAVPATKS